MTNDALKKQGMTVEKRETLPLGGGNAILAIVRQDTAGGPHPQVAADRADRQPDRAGFAGNAGHDAGALYRRRHPRHR